MAHWRSMEEITGGLVVSESRPWRQQCQKGIKG